VFEFTCLEVQQLVAEQPQELSKADDACNNDVKVTGSSASHQHQWQQARVPCTSVTQQFVKADDACSA